MLSGSIPHLTDKTIIKNAMKDNNKPEVNPVAIDMRDKLNRILKEISKPITKLVIR